MSREVRQRLAEVKTPRLSLLARHLAEGSGSGLHRANRRGSGIEFAGHREYSPGDDLRHLDRHALLRHGRHLIREFHTETERALHVVVDATASMEYAGTPTSPSKKRIALLLGAALLVTSRRLGDPMGLSLVTDRSDFTPPRGTNEHLERLLDSIDRIDAETSPTHGSALEKALSEVGSRVPRGTSVVVFTDALDDDARLASDIAALKTDRRGLTVAQILDPTEIDFPFDGPLRLSSPESSLVLDTDAARARQGYLDALERVTNRLRDRVTERGGRFLRISTAARVEESFRRVVLSIRGETA